MSDLVVLMEAKYDSLFKSIITAEWCVESDGHVESPQGYFSLVEIPALPGELKEMFDAVEFGSWEDWYELPAGWYFTTEDSNGMIRVYKSTEAKAKAAYAEALAGFEMWEAY